MYQSRHSLHHPVALNGAQKTQMNLALTARVREHALLALAAAPAAPPVALAAYPLPIPSLSPPCR